MTKPTWTEDAGLRRGLPDPDWQTRKFITVYPVCDFDCEYGTVTYWRVSICWGDTWGHLAIGIGDTVEEAMHEACESAINQKCPKEWLPCINWRREE